MNKLFDVAIVGCGITGIATAYYLARLHGISNIALIDCGQPMAFTSAQSGENYRNWWPHPSMVDFTNRSIELMEEIARETHNRINMTRRGYALATRDTDISDLIDQLYAGLGDSATDQVRIHEDVTAASYLSPHSSDWQSVPDGVDILRNAELIHTTFPTYSQEIQSVIHIRRGGDISGQQLGMYMLEYLVTQGATRINGTVSTISSGESFTLGIKAKNSCQSVNARKLVNAAGPFANEIATMLGVKIPVYNTFQQKIAFEDHASAIPRIMPFSIDLDPQRLDWQDDELELLRQDPKFEPFTHMMPGSVHCRPDGGENGSWVKLGWAYNVMQATPSWDLPLDDHFPELVLRGAAPARLHHYGGWYTLTDENWPLIGPLGKNKFLNDAFMNCALSGFGTMAACAGGELCAAWVAGKKLPSYAAAFSMQRYENDTLMNQLKSSNKGIL